MNKVVVEQLILSIYNGTNNEHIARNSRILDKFSEQPEAWNIAVDLIQSPHDGIRYFASNMLYTKVRKHWDQLSETQKHDLHNVVGQLLDSNDQGITTHMTKIYLNRLMLTYFSICCHIPGGLTHYLNIAASVITSHISVAPPSPSGGCTGSRGGSGNGGDNCGPTVAPGATNATIVNINKIMLGCSMFAIVPQEIEVLNLPSEEYRDQLAACCMALEEALLSSVIIPLAELIYSTLVATCPSADSTTLEQLVACYLLLLSILKGWCPLLGLSLTKLYKSYPACYEVMTQSLFLAKQVVLHSSACKHDRNGRRPLLQRVGLMISEALLLVKEIIDVNEYPVDEEVRHLVLDQVLTRGLFLGHWDLLSALLQVEPESLTYFFQTAACFAGFNAIFASDPLFVPPALLASQAAAERKMYQLLSTEDTAFAVTESLSFLLSSEMTYLSSAVSMTTTAPGLVPSSATVPSDHMRLFCMALYCTLQRPRKLVMGGLFEVWSTLQDMPMDHRHPLLRADIYGLVVLLLLDLLSYPLCLGDNSGDAIGEDDDDDEDDDGDEDEWAEDRSELRNWDNGIQDVMILSYYALGNQAFFMLLFQYLGPAATTTATTTTTGGGGDVSVMSVCWNKVEVVLCVLSMVMRVATDNDGEEEFTDEQLEVVPYLAQMSSGIMIYLQQQHQLQLKQYWQHQQERYTSASAHNLPSSSRCSNNSSSREFRRLIKAVCKYLCSVGSFVFKYQLPPDTDTGTGTGDGAAGTAASLVAVTAFRRALVSDYVGQLLEQYQFHQQQQHQHQHQQLLLLKTVLLIVSRGGGSYTVGELHTVADAFFQVTSECVAAIPRVCSGSSSSSSSGSSSIDLESSVPVRLVTICAKLCHLLSTVATNGGGGVEASYRPVDCLLTDIIGNSSNISRCIEEHILTLAEPAPIAPASADQQLAPAQLSSRDHQFVCLLNVVYQNSLCIYQVFCTLPKPEAPGEKVQEEKEDLTYSCQQQRTFLQHLFELPIITQYLSQLETLSLSLLQLQLQQYNCSQLPSVQATTTKTAAFVDRAAVRMYTAGICNSLALIFSQYAGLLFDQLVLLAPQTTATLESTINSLLHMADIALRFVVSNLNIDTALSCLQNVVVALSYVAKLPQLSLQMKHSIASFLISKIGLRVLQHMSSVTDPTKRSASTDATTTQQQQQQVCDSCRFLGTFVIECSDLLWIYGQDNTTLCDNPFSSSPPSSRIITLGDTCTLFITMLPEILLRLLNLYGTNSADNIAVICKPIFETLTLLFYPSPSNSNCSIVGGGYSSSRRLANTMKYHSFWLHHVMLMRNVPPAAVASATNASVTTPGNDWYAGQHVLEVLVKIMCGTLVETRSSSSVSHDKDLANAPSVPLMLSPVCWSLLSETLFWIVKGCSVDFNAEIREAIASSSHSQICSVTVPVSSFPALLPSTWYQDTSAHCRQYIASAFELERNISNDHSGVNLISIELRYKLVDCLFDLCLQQDDRQKFKEVVADIFSLCYGDATSVDVLSAHCC